MWGVLLAIAFAATVCYCVLRFAGNTPEPDVWPMTETVSGPHLSSGTIEDVRLGTNVPLKNAPAPETKPSFFDVEIEPVTDLVTLVDENGAEHEFEVADVIEVGTRDYALLLPIAGEDEVLILRLEPDDTFTMIEDEAEFQAVVAVLEREAEAWAA